jgi:hypothetical protein
MTKHSLQDRLVVTLGLALEEIHHPGSARNSGYDITAMCEAVIKEATHENVPQMIKDEMARRAAD